MSITQGVYSLAHLQTHHILVSAGVDRDAYVWNPYFKSLVTKLPGMCALQVELNAYVCS